MTHCIPVATIALLATAWATLPVRAQDADAPAVEAATAGELIIERPTLHSLGFDWRLTGDDDADATGQVHFRRKGDATWRESYPLLRTGRGRTANYGFGNFGDPAHRMRYRIPDGVAGSIIDLQPGTEYEVRLTLTDPDGVNGRAVRTQTLKTRPEPTLPKGGEVRHVYPPGYKGEKLKPAYNSIMHAVNGFQTWCDCYQTIHPNAAKPGTIVKLHAGLYKIDRRNYRQWSQRWLHGTITLVADGRPGKPIAIVAAGDGEVVIDGDGCDVLFNIRGADYLHFQGLTIRNTRIAFHGGVQGVLSPKGLTVRDCWLEDIQYGVLAQDARATDYTILDNVFIGRNPNDRFNPESGGAFGRTKAGYAVNLSGSGHAVGYNHMRNFWDVCNVFTNALADPNLGQQARSIDFYNNDIHNATDNFIESDGGYMNLRMLRNRCFNCMGAPLSIQPVYSGPVYWIRNIVYNAHKGGQAFKMSGGDNCVLLHNTSTCHYTVAGGMDHGDVRNNLFMGPDDYITERGRKRARRKVFAIGFKTATVDYNAHRVGLSGEGMFVVNGPEGGTFDTLAELASNTPYEHHSLTIDDYDVFAGADEPDHVPSNAGNLYHAHEVDLTPAEGAKIVDAGCRIPGINDDHAGKTPDIGAIERGKPLPTWGPRKRTNYLERLDDLRKGLYVPAYMAEQIAREARTVSGATAGSAIDKVLDADKDGTIEAITVGKHTWRAKDLAFGSARRADGSAVDDVCNLDLTTGLPTHTGEEIIVDVTAFDGAFWTDTNGERPDFFLFEAGGNDTVYVAALLAGNAVGKAVAVKSWGDTGIATPIGAGNAMGVCFDVTDLLDADGKPLSRDATLRGIRVLGRPAGMDPLCVCAVRGSTNP